MFDNKITKLEKKIEKLEVIIAMLQVETQLWRPPTQEDCMNGEEIKLNSSRGKDHILVRDIVEQLLDYLGLEIKLPQQSKSHSKFSLGAISPPSCVPAGTDVQTTEGNIPVEKLFDEKSEGSPKLYYHNKGLKLGLGGKLTTRVVRSVIREKTVSEELKPKSETEILVCLKMLLEDIEALIADSKGVTGLHLNGNVAPWDELTDGGRFEWIQLNKAREILAKFFK